MAFWSCKRLLYIVVWISLMSFVSDEPETILVISYQLSFRFLNIGSFPVLSQLFF